MKYTKTLLSSSILLALAASNALAQQTPPAFDATPLPVVESGPAMFGYDPELDRPTNPLLNSTEVPQYGFNNTIYLDQISSSGSTIGNTAFLSQDSTFGDGHFIGAEVVGEGNELSVSQSGFAAALELWNYGNDNIIDITQNTEFGYLVGYVIGNGNQANIEIQGDSGYGELVIQGDNNFAQSFSDDETSGTYILNVSGSGNEHYSEMFGVANTTFTYQWGDNNYVNEYISGGGNYVSTFLFGSDTVVETFVEGLFNTIGASVDFGSGNSFEIDVAGRDNQVGTWAAGDNNAFYAKTDGESNDYVSYNPIAGNGNTISVSQEGFSNQYFAFEFVGDDNVLDIIQDGTDNNADVALTGNSNYVSITQIGELNEASLSQNGDSEYFTIVQDGSENFAQIIPGGEGEFLTIDQTGSQNDAAVETAATVTGGIESEAIFNQVTVTQIGDLNLLDLYVGGGYNTVTVYQEGSFNWIAGEDGGPFVVDGGANNIELYQVGNDNMILGASAGNFNTISVYQEGDFNLAVIAQN